jgi:hypothetical protein
MVILRQEFLWCADFWARVTSYRTDRANRGFLLGVVDMSAIPREQEVNK